MNDRLDLLIKRYSALAAENKRLKETIHEQTRHMEELNSKLKELEQSMSERSANPAMGDEEKEQMKKRLDKVLADIDKILTTLND